MYLYIRRKSDGKILHSCSTQTIDNPDHMASAEKFITSRGMSLADYEIADSTQNELTVMIKDAITSEEKWMNDIRNTDKCMPRFLEDHITDAHDGVAGNEFLQGKYDDKKTLRATKP